MKSINEAKEYFENHKKIYGVAYSKCRHLHPTDDCEYYYAQGFVFASWNDAIGWLNAVTAKSEIDGFYDAGPFRKIGSTRVPYPRLNARELMSAEEIRRVGCEITAYVAPLDRLAQ